MPRYRLTVAYDGTNFHGWQRQIMPADLAHAHGHTLPSNEDGRIELRTVQKVLNDAIASVVRAPIEVLGASRTDAGVHAFHQTAAFTVPEDTPRPPDERLIDAINARLPDDVIVHACARTNEDFDPISHCIAKGYRYTLHCARTRPLWDRASVAHIREEHDLPRMREAAALLIGTHDFAAFAASGHGRESTVRTVIHCAVHELPPPANEPIPAQRLAIDIAADGFLWNMVRIIAGTLSEVGRGRMDPERITEAIESGNRRLAGPTLVPDGLCLMWGIYPQDDPQALAERHGFDPAILHNVPQRGGEATESTA
ncbi:MAG: tRNA pseudouridine(38-40) synthase TruA [Phycisphaeraceae bacterium]|nr:MAG: tRNA pseudouridine(38-40) synthase TruA [Phycisphaeraceae bacterium]